MFFLLFFGVGIGQASQTSIDFLQPCIFDSGFTSEPFQEIGMLFGSAMIPLESMNSNQPIEPQNGSCKYLGENGCSFGDDKPRYCKKFPLTENKNQKVILSNWSWLHCPKDTDYELMDMVNGKYLYVLKTPHPNKKDLVILDDKIENTIPNFYERFNGAHV